LLTASIKPTTPALNRSSIGICLGSRKWIRRAMNRTAGICCITSSLVVDSKRWIRTGQRSLVSVRASIRSSLLSIQLWTGRAASLIRYGLNCPIFRRFRTKLDFYPGIDQILRAYSPSCSEEAYSVSSRHLYFAVAGGERTIFSRAESREVSQFGTIDIQRSQSESKNEDGRVQRILLSVGLVMYRAPAAVL
jgi:hypothetical protein